jgi:hypothetical protein
MTMNGMLIMKFKEVVLACFKALLQKLIGKTDEKHKKFHNHTSVLPSSLSRTGVLFPGVKRGRGVMLTTHPHIVPRS